MPSERRTVLRSPTFRGLHPPEKLVGQFAFALQSCRGRTFGVWVAVLASGVRGERAVQRGRVFRYWPLGTPEYAL
jgi:hypothetical protein